MPDKIRFLRRQGHTKKGQKKHLGLFPAGFEPATLRVWSARDNHYTTETYCTLNLGSMLRPHGQVSFCGRFFAYWRCMSFHQEYVTCCSFFSEAVSWTKEATWKASPCRNNSVWPSGATDNASDYGSEDCRFESCLGQSLYFLQLIVDL